MCEKPSGAPGDGEEGGGQGVILEVPLWLEQRGSRVQGKRRREVAASSTKRGGVAAGGG